MTRHDYQDMSAGYEAPRGDDKVTAWADGFGRWHASVPISNPNRQAHMARKAIKDALDERGDRHPAYPLVVVREHVTNHGTVIYGEK